MSCSTGHGQVRCKQCSTSLPAGETAALCPRCLLVGALRAPAEEEPASGVPGPGLPLAGRRDFAGYELLGEIARGGMGVVFRARQRKPARIVALKVIAAGELASPRMVERFRTETSASARLDHPNIVPIYEVGHDAGWHFFSMRFIEGGTLADRLHGIPLPPADAARLMIKIARAVQHAHQRGVLHRDLKPGNVLIDAHGEPHLTDFGLAKVMEASVDLTRSHAILGTPAYMAPEQASGDTRDATMAVDVYGLGAVLYEMLAGSPPFAGDSGAILLRKIAEEDPVPPGVRAARALPGAAVPGRGATPHPADLDAICLKCLEKDPARRYATAEQLAADLERALIGEPIAARPSTTTQRMRKWVRRHPARTGLFATAALSLFVITAGSLVFSARLDHARRRAEASERLTRQSLADQHLHDNSRLNASHDGFRGLRPLLAAGRLADAVGGHAALWRERFATTLAFSPVLLRLWDVDEPVASLRFSPDGRHLVATLRSGGARAWDLVAGAALPPPADTGSPAVHSVIRPDGRQVLQFQSAPPRARLWNLPDGSLVDLDSSASPEPPGTYSADSRQFATGGAALQVWDSTTGQPLSVVRSPDRPLRQLVFSPDGRELISFHPRDTAWRWDLATGTRVGQRLAAYGAIDARFTPDGRYLNVAATGRVQMVRWPEGDVVTSVPAGRLLYEFHPNPDGRQFATAGFYDQARVWETRDGQPYRLPLTHESGANKVLFSPDGSLLATAGFDYQLRVVRAADHRAIASTLHRSALIEALAFSDDSRFVAAGDVTGLVEVWDLDAGPQPLLIGGEAMRHMAHSADGRWLVLEDAGHQLRVRHLGSNGAPDIVLPMPETPAGVSIDRAARHLAAAFPGHGVEIWDLSRRERRVHLAAANLPAVKQSRAVTFRPDGIELLTLGGQGVLQRWRTADGHPVGPAMQGRDPVQMIDWSPDGRYLVAGGRRWVRLWEASTGTPVGATIEGGPKEVLVDLRFSPDGTRLAVAFGNDAVEPGTSRVHAVPSLEPVGAAPWHGDGLASEAFSPDGTLLATGGEDNVARIWRVADGHPVTGALRHQSIVRGVLFRQDGRLLATGCVDGRLRLWDVARGELIAPPVQLGGMARPLVFTPDGRHLLASATGNSGAEMVWTIPVPAGDERRHPELLAECLTGLDAEPTRGDTPLSAADLAIRFKRLRELEPAAYAWPADSSGWHERRAAVAERMEQWFTAVFHLERCAAARPGDGRLAERLDRARLALSESP